MPQGRQGHFVLAREPGPVLDPLLVAAFFHACSHRIPEAYAAPQWGYMANLTSCASRAIIAFGAGTNRSI